MPVKLTMLRTGLTILGVALIMQPALASHRLHNHRADSMARSPAPMPRTVLHHDATPDLDDPSKYGGDSAPDTLNPPAPVHVQPRRGAFNPNSDEVKVVERQITDFDQMQRLENEAFDKKLVICRGC